MKLLEILSPRHGWMRNSFCVWLFGRLLAPCALCLLAAGPWLYPVGLGIELEAVPVCAFVVWRAESFLSRTGSAAMVCVCVCVAALFCGRWLSVLSLPDFLVSRSLRGCSALLSADVSDVLLLLLLYSPLTEHKHARKTSANRYCEVRRL
ncbi:trans-sialidase [Trypanosoma cruzi]|nr:trans-sialidase [Trypanosoma cruzi]